MMLLTSAAFLNAFDSKEFDFVAHSTYSNVMTTIQLEMQLQPIMCSTLERKKCQRRHEGE